MGNSTSTTDTVPMTEEDKARGEQFLEDLENEGKYWRDLTGEWDSHGNGEISTTTVIKSMRGVVSQSSGYSTVLKEMEEPVANSTDAYKHFEKLLNDPWMIKNHNDQVTKAREIYHKYWSLLSETSTTVNKILVASNSAIKAIDSYDLEMKYQETPDMDTIDNCVNRLQSWSTACKPLNDLQAKFNELGKEVDEQKQEWKKIEQECKSTFKKSLKPAMLFFCGILVVAAIGASLAFSGGIAGVAIGAAYLSWVELSCILGVGVLSGVEVYLGYTIAKKWKQWKKCELAKERCDEISKGVKTVQNCLDKVASGCIAVEKNLGDLAKKVHQIDQSIVDLQQTRDKLKNKMKNDTQNNRYIKVMVKGITKDFHQIRRDLRELNKECNKCIKLVDKCQQDIVDAVNGKKKSKFFAFF